jgi:hypothetical protein
MNDLKNLTLAWVSSTSSVFAAVEAKTRMTVMSAVILPIIFFALGKTVDVIVQVYLRRRDEQVRTGSGSDRVLNDESGGMRDEIADRE